MFLMNTPWSMRKAWENILGLPRKKYGKDVSSTAWIPNREISQEFLNAVDGTGWNGLIEEHTCVIE